MPGMGVVSERNGVPDSSSQRAAGPNAAANPVPQARSSPRWWASSAITSVPAPHWRAQRAATDATRAYVTATPSKSRGGRRLAASGTRWTPSPAAAAAHCRVSGVVGQTTATRWTAPSRSSARASSSAGRVLPAPGAAATRNGPDVHERIATSASRCHARRSADGVERAAAGTGAACCDTRRTDPRRAGLSALGGAEVRVDLDLDEHPGVGERGHDDRRVHGPHVAEGLEVRAREAVVAGLGREVDARADDVRQRGADTPERGLDRFERLAHLAVRVADAGDRAARHRRRRARDDDEIARADHPAVADGRLPRAAGAVTLDRAHQWRKWRRPVTTMATFAAPAAATTPPSRTQPPRCPN